MSQMATDQVVYEPLLPLTAVVGSSVGWSPPVDVRELPDEYIILADLPGVEPGAVEVTSQEETLRIEAVRRDRLRTGGVPIRLERSTGKLCRTLRLPASCDSSKISTQIRDGVLEVHVAKRAPREAKTRRGVSWASR
jgi:HSP20 family protein